MPHPECPECSLPTNPNWIDPSFKLRKKKFYASYTYDLYLIVSERFRSTLDGTGMRFIELPSTPGFYAAFADDVVPFDTVRRRTAFEQPCATCGRYFSVAGATPAFLQVQEPLDDKVFRTDIEFGTGTQRPLTLFGPGLAKRIWSAKLQGVVLQPVKSDYEFGPKAKSS